MGRFVPAEKHFFPSPHPPLPVGRRTAETGVIHFGSRTFNLICILTVNISLLHRYVQELSLRPKVDILFIEVRAL